MHGRVEHRVSVQIQSEQEQQATSANLSLGGMFINTSMALKERAHITLRFCVPTTPIPIVARAEVRWTEASGVGVSFLGLRAREMWALTRFLAPTPPG
jgi:hypothetical protein